MNTIPVDIANDSTLLRPNLHDGYLLGINLVSEDSLELTVAEVSGKKYRILLEGVVDLCAKDFREGNIILDVLVIPSKDVQLHHLSELAKGKPNSEGFEKHMRIILERIRRESLYVLELNPSYGCYLIVVAKNFSIQSVQQTF